MTDDEQQVVTARDGDTGRTLREARESAGYSVADVAEKQNLRPAIIETIEAGEYDQIDSELFLKGYVRSYAGLLGLDADALIKALDEELEPLREEAEEARRNDPLEEIERRKRQKLRMARWTAAFVLTVLAIWFVYWFAQSDIAQSGGQMLQDTIEQGTNQEAEPGDENGLSAPPEDDAPGSAPVESGEVESGEEPLTPDTQDSDALEPTGAVDEPTPTPSENATDPVSGEQSPETGGTGEGESVSDAGPSEVNPDTSAAEPDTMTGAAETAPETMSTSHDIVIAFSGDCWVQIQDGGQTVVSGLQRAGDEVRHTGTGPFRIVLGAVNAASVQFDGEAVDLSGIPAPNNRAVLTLGNDNA